MPRIYYTILGDEIDFPFYVMGVGVDYKQRDITRPEGFDKQQLIFCKSGRGEVEFDGKVYPFEKNTIVYLPKNFPHSYRGVSDEDFITCWVNFMGRETDKTLSVIGIDPTKPAIRHCADIKGLTLLLYKIFNLISEDRLYGNYYASAALYECFIELNKQINRKPSELDASDSQRMASIISYIKENYCKQIKMSDLCEISGYSEQHLCRLFRKHLNTRPVEYIELIRIQRAKELLIETNMPVIDIAKLIGYDNAAYFSKLFRRHISCTPSEYRRQNQMIYDAELNRK